MAATHEHLTDHDLYLFNEGSHTQLYNKLGAHPIKQGKERGVHFAVWAPDAVKVSVVGDFNQWNATSHPLSPQGSSGIWAAFIPGVKVGDNYKFHISSRFHGQELEKADPFGQWAEVPPKSASRVWSSAHTWSDGDWMKSRGARNGIKSPISIYEMHLGSWRRVPEEDNRPLTYLELAEQLPAYLAELGFTHVELLPVMEHPFDGSWGYQSLGYFAPTSRFGTPDDFKVLVDKLHQAGIGVILDWVPSHFATDGHGLGLFDGSHLYEHADPRQGHHPDWGSHVFNYDRNEVRSFLLSSAMLWLDEYHVDGIRVDAVASMLYLDYSRNDGEWIPNVHGGNENLGAIQFLQRMNSEIFSRFPDVQTFAEESTSWPMVSRPVYVGGLGFGFKWDMGWMHDMLEYMEKEPIHRRYHHRNLTFRMLYAWHENFTLPLSHDEVVHGKGSLLGKMPGDLWQKFANLRVLFGKMFAQPGKKLIFMGGEFGQWNEWNHGDNLEWHLTQYIEHSGLQRWVADLNRVYREEAALHSTDCDHSGFEWVDCSDSDGSCIAFLRTTPDKTQCILAAFNFTPVPRIGYRLGVPHGGKWREVLNSDAATYGGSGMGNAGGVLAQDLPWHARSHSVEITLPPMAAVLFRSEGE